MKPGYPLAALLLLAACGNATSAPPEADVAPVLDGRAKLAPRALADLSYQRAAQGARWLAGVVREDGAFYYAYNPGKDRYDEEAYNEVRHAGSTYSMWQLHEAIRQAEGEDARLRRAAEAATGWLDRNSIDLGERGRAFVYKGRMKLGGQALALVALLERRRVTGDTSRDPLIAGLAKFMLAMELPGEPGRYHQSFDARTGELLLTPPSNFYPGEALLALTRLAQQDFQGGPWLDAARRAARYLIYTKDGDIPAAGKIPRQDHWLTMALAELYRLDPQDSYRTVVYMQGDEMTSSQNGADAHPQRIGAAQRPLPSYTSTATKGEALAAAWALARKLGDAEGARQFGDAAMRNAQFRMRVQWQPANSGLFPAPERLNGAWSAGPANAKVQIDYVQHNISALAGVWHLARGADLPLAGEERARPATPATRAATGS